MEKLQCIKNEAITVNSKKKAGTIRNSGKRDKSRFYSLTKLDQPISMDYTLNEYEYSFSDYLTEEYYRNGYA